LYHVISRGNERQDIVRDETDREKRLDWLRRTVEVYGWRLHAFVVMSNHDHLFVETPEANLSAGMQHYNGSYTGYFNRRHGRAGHLFQGRFQGHLIEEQGYFLEVSRYIHLNPVRAMLIEAPESWRWSSCAGYVRVRHRLDWVCYERVLGEFGRGDEAARRSYGKYLRVGLEQPPPSPFTEAVGGLIVGTSEFVDRIRCLIENRREDSEIPQLKRVRSRPALAAIVQAVSAHFGVEGKCWAAGRRSDDAARAAAAYLARCRFGYGAGETAAMLGYRDHSGVGRAVRRVEQGDAELRRTIQRLERRLTNPYSRPDPTPCTKKLLL
jgi:REP element-mobilizing transposase RayT